VHSWLAFSAMMMGRWSLPIQGTSVIVAEVAMDAAVMVRSIVDAFPDTGFRRVPRLVGVMRQASWSFIRAS
jgi:hypothetical protein